MEVLPMILSAGKVTLLATSTAGVSILRIVMGLVFALLRRNNSEPYVSRLYWVCWVSSLVRLLLVQILSHIMLPCQNLGSVCQPTLQQQGVFAWAFIMVRIIREVFVGLLMALKKANGKPLEAFKFNHFWYLQRTLCFLKSHSVRWYRRQGITSLPCLRKPLSAFCHFTLLGNVADWQNDYLVPKTSVI